MIVAGLGFRSGVGADEIVALVAQALADAALGPGDLAGLATVSDKADEPGFRAAAERLAVPALALARRAILCAAPAGVTVSARSLAAAGVNSLAEAAALAGAGRHAALVLPRIASRRATCALARGTAP